MKTISGQAIMVVAALAATLAVAVISYRTIERDLTDSALERRTALSFLTASLLNEKFERLIDIGVSLGSRVRFRELVDDGDWAEAGRVLNGVPSDFPMIERLTLHDLKGTLVADVPAVAAVRGQNFAHRDWYRAVIDTGQPYISRVYLRNAPPRFNIFAAAIPIKGPGGQLRAILVLQIRLERFFEWAKRVDLGERGALYVVDRHGMLASHSDRPPQENLIDYSQVPAVKQLREGKRGIQTAIDPLDGKDHVFAFEPIAKYQWGVIIEQPASVVFASRNEQLRRILYIYAAILLLMIVVAWLSRRVANERRKSREVHEQQAAVLQSILDSIGDGIIVTDEKLHVLLINPVARRMIGLRPGDPPPDNWAEVPGRFLPDTITPMPADRLFISRALRGENVDDEEVFIRHATLPDGIWVSGTARPLAAVDGRAQAVMVWRDITERRHTEMKLQALKLEAEQRAVQLDTTNKELESFTYSVSHDLRSPLRAIDGFSKIVLDEYGPRLDDEARRLLGVIRANAQKMAVLIDDLLEFSRLGRRTLTVNNVNMKQLAEESLQEVRATMPVLNVAISIEALPPAPGDRALLRQVWINLLSNALKFSGKARHPAITVSGHLHGPENIYVVRDNGAGFDMQYYSKLFGVFQRLHAVQDYPGTGVGLAIVQRVVSRHGGRVWAESKVDQGATFYFSLPAARNKEASTDA